MGNILALPQAGTLGSVRWKAVGVSGLESDGMTAS
jgi:hypothetical protein